VAIIFGAEIMKNMINRIDVGVKDFFEKKAKEKKELIKNQRNWKQATAINFIEDRFELLVDDFQSETGLAREEAIDLLDEAITNTYYPDIEDEMFDLVNGGIW
jgi:hypothetical protein